MTSTLLGKAVHLVPLSQMTCWTLAALPVSRGSPASTNSTGAFRSASEVLAPCADNPATSSTMVESLSVAGTFRPFVQRPQPLAA